MNDQTHPTKQNKTPNVANSSELIEDVENFVKSRSAPAIGVIGKAGMYDTKAHSAHDFTVGGRLKTRWVNDDPTSIAKRRSQGFVFPSDVSKRLPDHKMKNQRLMVIPTEHHKALRAQIDNVTARYEGSVFGNDAKARAGRTKDGGGMEGFKVATPDGAETTPTNTGIPSGKAPQGESKAPIGSK